MYSSSNLRIDVRLRSYYSNSGRLWSAVTGVHATALDFRTNLCEFKLEIYSKYQTEHGDFRLLLNGQDVG